MTEKKLVQGVDYNIVNGKWVFTAKYLRDRGYCCKNGCVNCPYGFRKKPQISPKGDK